MQFNYVTFFSFRRLQNKTYNRIFHKNKHFFDEAKNKNFNDTQLKVSAYYTWNPPKKIQSYFSEWIVRAIAQFVCLPWTGHLLMIGQWKPASHLISISLQVINKCKPKERGRLKIDLTKRKGGFRVFLRLVSLVFVSSSLATSNATALGRHLFTVFDLFIDICDLEK